MVGPIFFQEMLVNSRRSRHHYLRWLYVGWLVTQLAYFVVTEWFALIAGFHDQTQQLTFLVSQSFTSTFLVQHFVLLFLVTPTFIAGGLTDEKTRGTLQYLLTTDLASIHIVFGKLLGRLTEVLTLAFVGIPFLCFVGGLGGAELALIIGVILFTIEIGVGIAAATLLAAVWSRQTRDAVLGLYAIALVAILLGVLVGGPLRVLFPATFLDSLVAFFEVLVRYFNPLYVLEPALVPGDTGAGEMFRRLFAGVFAWGGLACACVGLATWRLRPAYTKQLEGEGRKKVTWWRVDRIAVTEEPIRWKERHVEGLAPHPSLKRVPRWIGLVSITSLTLFGGLLILALHLPGGIKIPQALGMLLRLEILELKAALLPADDAFLLMGLLGMLFFSFLVGVRCSGAVTGERERQTWEALLLSPLTAHQLIRGKVWGIMGVSYVYLSAYAIPAVALAALGGGVCLFWILLWLGVTILAMYYLGAAGIWSSVRSRTSWRSLLSALGFAYLGGFIVYLITTPVIFIAAMIIALALAVVDFRFGTNLAPSGAGFLQYFVGFAIASCLGLALMFWLASRLFLNSAQKWVAERERTRHWHDEPTYRRPRRRIARSR